MLWSGDLGRLINPPSRSYSSSTCIAVAFSAWSPHSVGTASLVALGSSTIPLGVGCGDNRTFAASVMSASCVPQIVAEDGACEILRRFGKSYGLREAMFQTRSQSQRFWLTPIGTAFKWGRLRSDLKVGITVRTCCDGHH